MSSSKLIIGSFVLLRYNYSHKHQKKRIFAARNGEVSDEGLPVYAFRSGLDDTETATPAYALLGASAGTDLVIRGKTRLSLYLIGTNLTDQAYMSHLSQLKYIGIAGMGRNLVLKLIVPL